MNTKNIKATASPMPGCPAWTVAVFKAEDVPEGTEVVPAAPVQARHSDDAAIDRFATVMKAKMAASRAKGRSGWDDPAQCSVENLAAMLCQHVEKGDPVDIANFTMMIYERQGTAIDVYEALAVFLNSRSVTAPMQAQEPVADIWTCTRMHDMGTVKGAKGEFIAQSYFKDMKTLTDRHNASFRAPVQPVAVPDGIRGPLTEAQKQEARSLYANLQHLSRDAAEQFIRHVSTTAYVNGHKDAAPAAQGDAISQQQIAEIIDSYTDQGTKETSIDDAAEAILAAIAAKAAS